MKAKFPVKHKPNLGRPKLKKRPRRGKKAQAATLISILEPAHLAVHGVHRLERTGERLVHRLGGSDDTGGAGGLRYLVGQTVEIDDLDLPDDVIAGLEEEIRGIMDTTGLAIMAEAEDTVPVDTGLLKSLLYYDVDDTALMLHVGDTAPYASYVEEGTIHMNPRPYLSLAMAGNMEEMEAEIDGAIATALDEQAQNEDAGLADVAIGDSEVEVEVAIETLALDEL